MKTMLKHLLFIILYFSIGFVGCKGKSENKTIEGKEEITQGEEMKSASGTPSYSAKGQSQDAKDIVYVLKMNGSIDSISYNIGQVIIKDDTGNIILLHIDKGNIELRDFNTGDPI